jgi:hypothetical protein
MVRSAMPSDLSVRAVGPVPGSSENPAGPKSEAFMPPAQATPAPPTILVANPTLRFDVASGLVVIEFHDAAGDITTSVPTLRQLEAYRLHGQTSVSQTPPAAPSPASSAAASQGPSTAASQAQPAAASQAPSAAASVHVSATTKV